MFILNSHVSCVKFKDRHHMLRAIKYMGNCLPDFSNQNIIQKTCLAR